ncbi:DegV family protein [Alkaliphilus pronyensis]|uniref:DegV family protein n=1 Tax=Alkaliphilus pronyensis TaxID=1482732 RepID=A0A6I0FHW7_9FIRM|nr:DegV family protein [Alkaliphilus pronyensis]KAB3535761.1 DegV family protein [Alkaliphilus pronyensis]
MGIKVLTDSTSYIDELTKQQLDIRIIPLRVEFPDQTFKETELNNESFYEMMDKKGIPKSSQPSVGDFYCEMEKVIKEGHELVCFFLSSDMSGTYYTANLAKDMVLDNYPDAKIEVIDSRSNCMQLGFVAIEAAKAGKENKPLEEVVKIAKANIKKSRFLFIPDNLKYLEKGGRIGRANAIIGNLLKIIPILTVENGVTSIFKKVRTKKKAVITIVDQVIKDIKSYGLGNIVIHHINCKDEAFEVVKELKKFIDVNIKIQDIGPVIGLHVGPGAIGVVYYTKEDLR